MVNWYCNLFSYDGYCLLRLFFGLKWNRNLSNLSFNINNNNRPYFIKFYDNLHTLETQLLIRDENRHKSGIYCIRNKINNKLYIGSAISNRLNTRFRNHCIHFTGNSNQNKAINKYGLHNFEFLILEYHAGIILKENLKKAHIKLQELETEYIKYYKPEYNLTTLGYKHTEETNYSEDRKVFISNYFNNNIIKTDSDLNKFRLIALERYQSQPNLKSQISKALSKPVILYNLDNTIHSEYPSVRNMAKVFKCCHKTINKAINSQSIFQNIGYIKYKTKL